MAIDDNIVAITMTIQGDNIAKFVNKGIMGAPQLNGKSVDYNETDKKIDDNTMETVICGDVSEMTLEENVDVEFNIVWVGDVKGPWDFKFKTTKNGTSKYSETIDINKKISLPTGKLASEFEIEKLVMSPFGNTLNVRGTYYEKNEDMRNGILDYVVTDNEGKILNIEHSGSYSNDKKYNQEIQLNKETKVIIKSIEATQEKTKITVKVEGNYTDANIDSVVLFNGDYVDTSREEDGNGAKVEDSENNIISIELKPVDITQNYKIAIKTRNKGYAFVDVAS
ncbi:hypothetical protein psyc5s11_04330 [Clostridium gelidum]|uniref:DUF5643 domain-containing protein n=1 Tax=Clostridium gelidum TaxID=704125 RepID=A0ABN6IRZ1_9CLOT|nr:DUF5643 domain-containing protein [Clostridium gelidum]BCZ44366.1 hypothetical protein psyc5s11_04330 [Clostridium gelidum]